MVNYKKISGWDLAGVAFCGDLFLFGCVNGLLWGLACEEGGYQRVQAVAASTQQHSINGKVVIFSRNIYLTKLFSSVIKQAFSSISAS